MTFGDSNSSTPRVTVFFATGFLSGAGFGVAATYLTAGFFAVGLLTVVFAVPGFFTAVSVAFVVVFLATGLAEGFVALAVFFVLLIVSAMFIPFINVGT